MSVGPQGRSGEGGARPRRLNGRDRDRSTLTRIRCWCWGGLGWKERGCERGWRGVEHWIEGGVVRVGGLES